MIRAQQPPRGVVGAQGVEGREVHDPRMMPQERVGCDL
jgi:hypothetical protein